MAIKVTALGAAAETPKPQLKLLQQSGNPEADVAAATLNIRLRFPLRPEVPLSEMADMTALERTRWEIRIRSQTALYAQTMSLHGSDVASLLA